MSATASTQIVGPYDAFSTQDKIRVTCGVPHEIHKQLFDLTFKRRGAQDKILARLLHLFLVALSSQKYKTLLDNCLTDRDREDVANALLNELAEYEL